MKYCTCENGNNLIFVRGENTSCDVSACNSINFDSAVYSSFLTLVLTHGFHGFSYAESDLDYIYTNWQ